MQKTIAIKLSPNTFTVPEVRVKSNVIQIENIVTKPLAPPCQCYLPMKKYFR